MFLPTVLLLSLATAMVANDDVQCLNGGIRIPGGDEFWPCNCGPDFTGTYCGIPTKNEKTHLVTSSEFKEFVFVDFRNENLTVEPPLPAHQYTISQRFQSDDGKPVEILIKDLGPEFEPCDGILNDAHRLKLNGKGIDCYVREKGIVGKEGNLLLEVMFTNMPQRFNITVLARKLVVSCLNGGIAIADDSQWAPCECTPQYTGKYCGILKQSFQSYEVTSSEFEEFVFVDFRNKNLTEEPAHTMLQYTVRMEFQSDDGSPIEIVIKDLGPVYMMCLSWLPQHYFVKVNGVDVDCYRRLHRNADEGKIVLDAIFPNMAERYNLTVDARKIAPPTYHKCQNGGAPVSDGLWKDRKCVCPMGYTGDFCEVIIEITERILIDTSTTYINAMKSVSFKNTLTPRIAEFEFESKNGALLNLTVEKLPSEYVCEQPYSYWSNGQNYGTVLVDFALGHFARNFFCIQDIESVLVGFTNKITLRMMFNYKNKPNEYGIIKGEEQFVEFEFKVNH